jgi:F-type H+-transporting ATPase subunit alpha
MEMLKQPQFAPLAMEEQAAVLFVSINGYLMDVPVDTVSGFVKEFLEYLKLRKGEVLKELVDSGAMSSAVEQGLSDAITGFKQSRAAGARN